MRDPLAPKSERREDVGMWNAPRLKYVLSCFEVPPEIRISDRLSGKRKDDCEKDENEQQPVRLKRARKSSS